MNENRTLQLTYSIDDSISVWVFSQASTQAGDGL